MAKRKPPRAGREGDRQGSRGAGVPEQATGVPLKWLLGLLLLLVPWIPAAAHQPPEARQAMQFGLRVEPSAWAAMEEALAAEPCDPGNPLGVTLDIPSPWADRPDWAALDKAAAAVASAHARLTIATQLPQNARERYLATLSERLGLQASTMELSVSPGDVEGVERGGNAQGALDIKRWASLLRGNSKANILIGNLTPDLLRLLSPMYQESLDAYVDGYGAGPFPPDELLPS
ncbi:MAG: hypothetical protein ACP5VF_12790, partial [Acidobacteriota bacterium]